MIVHSDTFVMDGIEDDCENLVHSLNREKDDLQPILFVGLVDRAEFVRSAGSERIRFGGEDRESFVAERTRSLDTCESQRSKPNDYRCDTYVRLTS